jgi:multidrug efflux pump subunit AcrB
MLKGLVAFWARNPVAGNLLMAACWVVGLMSFSIMDREFFPPGRGDNVRIEAVWPGASPEDMESQVTVRLEEAITDLDGIDWIQSRSQEGFAWVNVIADQGADIESLQAEIKSRVDGISGLPSNIEPPRVSRQMNRNFSIILAVHGNVEERVLRDTAERVRDEISLLPGGANIQMRGGRTPEVSIEISEDSLRRYGLSFDDVAQAVRASSLNLSSGAVRTADGDYQLRARNLADNRVDFESIVVRQEADGGVVRIGDVATVIDGFQDVNIYAKTNGERSITLFILTADKFNIQETDKALRAYLEKEKAQLPSGVQITPVYNEVEDFNALTGILMQNASQGFALIFFLLLITLHPKVAFWATLGVVTAFAGSFIILPYIDISLNFMTVFAFLLVLGIMVDDAIIVGEAVYERVERGETGVDAAILATQLVLKPLVASVCVTMLAFSPLMFLSGDVRQFTSIISLVVMSTLFFSLVESLIILPGHLTKVTLPKTGDSGFGKLMALQQRCAHSVIWVAKNFHGPFMRQAVRWRYLTLSVFVVSMVVAGTLFAGGWIKQTFMPDVEGDFMIVSIEMPKTTPFARMEQVAEQLNRVRVQIEEETKESAQKDGYTGQMSRGVIRSWSQPIQENTINAYVLLTPPETRPKLRTKKVQERLKELLGEIPDAERVSLEFGGGGGGPGIQIAILGQNQQDLRAAVDELKAKLLSYSAVSSVKDSEESAAEELRYQLKPGAEQLGITLADVSKQVRQAYLGEEVQRLPRDGDDVRVYVRYPEAVRESLSSLDNFRVRTSDGREVPLTAVAGWTYAPGVTGLDRRQRMRSIMVDAEIQDEERAKVMKDINETFMPMLQAKYTTISSRALGEAEAQAEFFAELGRFGLMALFAIYFMLAVVFRSYWQPALIMSAIPFAFIGAVVGHFMFGASFALFSWLGMVAAMGVIVNDNVVLVDRANQFCEEGMEAFDAITEASASRFRQIFLTSVTEFVGLAPMIFEMAAIAQFLKPMALSLAFGVLLAMPATLILTPVFYMIGKDIKRQFGKLKRLWLRGWRGADPAEVAAEQANREH